MGTESLVTAEEPLAMPDDGSHYELIAGEIKKISPVGIVHGLVGGQLAGQDVVHNFRCRVSEIFETL
ncbi:MAG: hypothetical protein FJ290_32160 [Planctomycetes bacterium]|nr:hypothetical protein [Planctomycetota bacterium]